MPVTLPVSVYLLRPECQRGVDVGVPVGLLVPIPAMASHG